MRVPPALPLCTAAATAATAAADAAKFCASGMDVDLRHPIPEGMKSMSTCSVECLLFLLEHVEPRGFNKSSMRGMLKAKQRKHSRAQLLELAEYTIDLDPDACLGHSHKHLSTRRALEHLERIHGSAWPGRRRAH